MYGARFESALAYSCALHFGQRRKGDGAPYITHPLNVAALVGQYGGDEDQAIAALLHDSIEDCGVTRARLAARYGPRVADIVADCSDSTSVPKPPWRARKEAHIQRVRHFTAASKLVIAADKLHNAMSITRDLRRPSVGEAVWSRFTAPKPQVIWYYQTMAAALGHQWQHELLVELHYIVAQLG